MAGGTRLPGHRVSRLSAYGLLASAVAVLMSQTCLERRTGKSAGEFAPRDSVGMAEQPQLVDISTLPYEQLVMLKNQFEQVTSAYTSDGTWMTRLSCVSRRFKAWHSCPGR